MDDFLLWYYFILRLSNNTNKHKKTKISSTENIFLLDVDEQEAASQLLAGIILQFQDAVPIPHQTDGHSCLCKLDRIRI
jgi:hypothetical protein